jgi:modulator of FtsH protease HflK
VPVPAGICDRRAVSVLEQAAARAVREVVGTNDLDFVLVGEGRTFLEMTTMELVQATLNTYQAGMTVTQVNLQDANFPQAVQPAVEDAIKAREDRERKPLEAEAYANDVIPRARGQAARTIEEGEAYRARLVARAEGDASRVTQLVTEYQRYPAVTRERLYLETMEEVLGRTPKIILDVSDGPGNIMYLPLDKLMERRSASNFRSEGTGAEARAEEIEEADRRAREALRARGGRR